MTHELPPDFIIKCDVAAHELTDERWWFELPQVIRDALVVAPCCGVYRLDKEVGGHLVGVYSLSGDDGADLLDVTWTVYVGPELNPGLIGPPRCVRGILADELEWICCGYPSRDLVVARDRIVKAGRA